MAEKYRNRITKMVVMRAGDLLKNDGNWRVHPLFQKQALEGVLESVGKTDTLKAYASDRYGGMLTLVDGHLRKEFDPEEEWPVLILDIDDDEADLILAHLDSITNQAETDALKLDELLQRSQKVQNEKLQASSQRLQEKIAKQVEIAKRARGDDVPKKQKDSTYANLRQQKSVKVVIPAGDDLATVEKAIKLTGEVNRGQALLAICSNYIEMKHGEN